MHAVLGAVVASVGATDPTVQPVTQSFYMFAVLAVLLILLLWSMLRHMRRARTNLGDEPPGGGLPPTPRTGGSDEQR